MSRSSLELPPVELAVRPAARAPDDARPLADEPETWQFLRQAVLPELLEARRSTPIRVWCAGPGAAEDAGSVVALLADLTDPDRLSRQLKVFATSPEDDRASHRSPCWHELDRLASPFARSPMMRDIVFFGRHDLLADPPLSRLDLVLCRRALNAVESSAGRLVLKRLNYALNDGGWLVVGRRDRELVSMCELFEAVEPTCGVFRKGRPASIRSLMPLAARQAGAAQHGAELDQAVAAALGEEGGCGHLLLDPTGTIVMADDVARSMLGAPDGGGLPERMALGRQLDRLEGVMKEVGATGAPAVVEEMALPVGHGETGRFEVELSAIRSGAGANAGFLLRLRRSGWRRIVAFRVRQACQPLELATELLRSSEEELRAACEELERAHDELQACNQRLADANAMLVVEQRALSERCAELTATLQGTSGAVLTTTAAGTVVACTAAAAARFGWPIERMQGQPLASFLTPRKPTRPQPRSGRRDASLQLLAASGEAVGHRADGTAFETGLDVTRTMVGRRTLFVLRLGDERGPKPDAGRSDGARASAFHLSELTPREREVLRFLVEGRQSKEIAHALGISRRTVDIHRGRLMRKIHARSIADLIRIAIAERLITQR